MGGGEITVAAGRVNPPNLLGSMLAGLTINSNHRGDGGVGARPLFLPGRKRNSERQPKEGMGGGGAGQMRDGGGRPAQTKMDKPPPYITG